MLEMAMFKQTVTNFINTHWYGEDFMGNGRYGWERASYNDSTTELKFVEEMGPYGPDWILRARLLKNDDGSGPALHHYFPNLDHTNLYRFTIWVKLDEFIGKGVFYQGTNTDGSIANMSDGSINTNPYFNSSIGKNKIPIDEWLLVVGYLHPLGTSNTSAILSAIYRKDGSKVREGTNDLKFSKTTTAHVRFLPLHYADKNDEILWYHPRFEIINGKEPSIADILARKCP